VLGVLCCFDLKKHKKLLQSQVLYILLNIMQIFLNKKAHLLDGSIFSMALLLIMPY